MKKTSKKGKRMKTQGIIFDKDGTLIDFDAFWVAVSRKALGCVIAKFNMDNALVEDILLAFGVHGGVTSINGVLCRGTYAQMGKIVYDVFKKYGCDNSCDEITGALVAAYNESADAGEIKPTSPMLAEVLRGLKAKGKRLAVVTTDNELITRKCLSALGIEELFDKIYADDGVNPTKPDPYCALDFCERFGLEKEKTVMGTD